MTASKPPIAPPPPPPPPGTRPRARARRLLIGLLIAANVIVFGALAVVWFAAQQVASSVSTIPAAGLELTAEPPRLSEARTFLLIGSDSRENVGGLSADFGNFGGERADVVILMQLLPGEDRLQMLSLPRDLKVTWNGSTRKINETFAVGGAAGIIEAVQSHTGLPVHHYVEVDFAGFAGLVDAMGGIRMTFPHRARDIKAELDVSPGTRLLDGETALALARSRSYQELIDGRWVSVDATDIGRTSRQQDLLMAMFTQIERPATIAGYGDLLDALGSFVIIDDSLDTDDIIQLAWEMRSAGPEALDAVTLPVRITTEGGVSYVVEVEPDATAVVAAFEAGEPLRDAPAALRVAVENGNGQAGSAAAMSDLLEAAGYDVVSVGNSGRSDYQATLVVARPVDLDTASEVVSALGFGQATSGRLPEDVDLLVIVGADAP